LVSLITILLLSQLDHFGFDAISSPQTAGVAFQCIAYAYDSFNNVVDYNGPAEVFATPGTQYGWQQVNFSSGMWQGQFTATLANSYTITCRDYNVPAHTGESNSVLFNTNTPYKVLAILPGETYIQGIESGKIDDVIPQVAGDTFNIEIYYTDQWSNLINTGNDACQIVSTDSFTMPQGFTLNSGCDTVSFACRTAGQHYFYTSDITNPSIKSDTSSSISVYAGAYSKLLVLLPGETHLPGDTTIDYYSTPGKSSVPNDQYAGSAFTVMVYATDTMWNKTSSSGSQVQLYSDFSFNNPSPENLSNGEAQFMVYFAFGGDNQNLWAEDDTITSYRNYLNILMEIDTTVVPDSFIAYPNPMGIETQHMVFAYYLDSSCNVIIAIYDPFGNLVYQREIAPGGTGARAGLNRLIWYGRNDEGQRVASGAYYVVIKGWTHTATIFHKKMKVGVVW